jgi:glucose/arabinose dehydrogenase
MNNYSNKPHQKRSPQKGIEIIKYGFLIWLLFIIAGCSSQPSTPKTPPPTSPPRTTEPEQPTKFLNDTPTAWDTGQPTSTTPTTETLDEASRATPAPLYPAAFPDPQSYAWQTVLSGLNSPVGLANAADGSGRLFIIEQSGLIRIWVEGSLLGTPFLDIQNRIGSQASEQGLLGLAFHPNYADNGYFFVNYTDMDGNTAISRFQVSGQDPNRADPGSETVLLTISQPYENHNGGMLAFGSDGYLYIGTGDGGSGGDPQNNAQSLDTLLGKMLRIDIDQEEGYAVPADNPLPEHPYAEIWAYGLRNPWRFSFDALTGDLYIGDVGQSEWEEIDYLPHDASGGINFGWNYYEGSHPFQGSHPADQTFTEPVAEYGHDLGCSVTGGVVYRGQELPEWQGIYFYGDFCTGNLWGLFQTAAGEWNSLLLYQNLAMTTSFGEDEAGEVYLLDYAGSLLKFQEIK